MRKAQFPCPAMTGLRLTLYESSAVCCEPKLVLGLYAVRPEAGRRHTSHEQYRLDDAVSTILSPTRQTQLPLSAGDPHAFAADDIQICNHC